MKTTLQNIHDLLKDKSLMISCAESLTGGMFGSMLSAISGSSAYFVGGIISYADQVKKEQLGVSDAILNEYSAVSEASAKQMAEACRRLFKTDLAVSLTGLAGPNADSHFPNIPVGRVYIGIASKETCFVFEETFEAALGREGIRMRSCEKALQHLYGLITL